MFYNTPQPGSVWRLGGEFRCVTEVMEGDIFWAGFEQPGGPLSKAEWDEWAARAVQVWPLDQDADRVQEAGPGLLAALQRAVTKIESLQSLLVCYRTGTRPSEKLLASLDTLIDAESTARVAIEKATTTEVAT